MAERWVEDFDSSDFVLPKFVPIHNRPFCFDLLPHFPAAPPQHTVP